MKKGSALLVVLGMLSFMVMSAVAFAMFMRQNRLPSSFLRQKIAASMLVKAGLARAMSEIDLKMGNDLYPGYGSRADNIWHHRVFSPGDASASVSPETTAATLTLEGLAYIPPPLVNTARYWSRHVTTAQWQSLGYDVGRYAYTAINVSDYLDINRLKAGVMRDSSPSNRVSMAGLFDIAFNNNGAQRAEKFDDFVRQAESDQFKTRFISLADYNLALGTKGAGTTGLVSPFYTYIENPTSDGSFYGPNAASAKTQKFVTDSWYPQSHDEEIKGALDGTHYVDINDIDEGLISLMKNSSSLGFTEIRNHLNLAECAAFVDYLDEDNIPTSLAQPTVERVPMLTGLQVLPVNVKPNFKMETIPGDPIQSAGGNNDRWMYRAWRLGDLGDGRLLVGGSAVFPFKRTSGLSGNSSYPAKIYAKFFFTDTADDKDFAKTRAQVNVKYRPKTAGEWKNQQNLPEGWWGLAGEGKVSVKSSVKTEEDALCALVPDGAMDFSDVINIPNGQGYVYAVKYRESNPDEVMPLDEQDRSRFNWLKVRTPEGKSEDITELAGTSKIRLTAMVWVRLLDGTDTVDMVPATIQDDEIYNRMPSMPEEVKYMLGEYTDREGVLPILGPEIVSLDGEQFKDKTADVSFTAPEVNGLRIYCCDPRYNWAPEDWFAAENGATISGGNWLDQIRGNYLNGSDYHPNDIFLFVANQGYLQSMGELDMLPLVRKSYDDFQYQEGGTSNPLESSFHQKPERYVTKGEQTLSREAGNVRSANDLANHEYMWKQRWAFGEKAYRHINKVNDPRTWGIVDSMTGSAINPFGEVDIVKTALAYTPYDWIITGENFKLAHPKLSSGKEYCFCEDSSEAPLKNDELTTIATKLQQRVRAAGNNWEEEWGKWEEWDSADFFGVNLGDEFHDVDRKFLCAYWRNCFANQQLFLIFVRAEPTVMGGASAGRTPAQLGGRAVALVWRDPKAPTASGNNSSLNASEANNLSRPHRMRILFYHQLD